jgi:hypothetical protein
MAQESFNEDGEVRETEAQREKEWEQEWEQEEESRTPGYWWTKVAWVVLLTVALYLLGRSMVRNHFFTGGAMNYHNRPTGP